ncbi:hypothetical protein HER10_EVM0008441 [Colletotrichum scovillei]|uniref:uncharacterized protein n=1 Tax=Colletotrichum scovillei TaxID=1209932 RepID=UPI0015C3F31E|nr:uncharacterized protein HER10_EVM0008441 [Colletotrichum scovillei]KAF4781192.1 hypothetical protein HER10_EVM0008441 [Colletotrichum scovillei]
MMPPTIEDCSTPTHLHLHPSAHNHATEAAEPSQAIVAPKFLENQERSGMNASDGDPFATRTDECHLVWWDNDQDPENPHNWPRWKKLVNCGLISLLTLIEPLASSIFAPGIPKLMQDFNSTNRELSAFVVSVYVLGFAFGPMVLAPLSEMWGRVAIYHITNFIFLAFTVACAVAPSLSSLVVFRFLAGTFGAAPMTNGGGSIADMFRAEERAGVMAVFSVGPLIGPIIGPIIGGFLTDAKGWRWDFWLVVILAGAICVAMLFTLRETYSPVILERKARRLRQETGDGRFRSRLDTGITTNGLFRKCVVRPIKLLVFSPICTILAFYLGIVYGYIYILFTSVPYVFEDFYGFSTEMVGLVYLGLGVGAFAGMTWFAIDSSRVSKDQPIIKPETRLRLLPVAAVVFPIGLFVYGWTAEHRVQFMAPIIGLALIGVGNFMAICTYLVDAYELYAASALAANIIIRSLAGAFLPLCGMKMYNALGLGWGNAMLGFIAAALIPVPFLLSRYGERLRTKFDVSRL